MPLVGLDVGVDFGLDFGLDIEKGNTKLVATTTNNLQICFWDSNNYTYVIYWKCSVKMSSV